MHDIMYIKYKINVNKYLNENNLKFEMDEITHKSAQAKIENYNIFYMDFQNNELLKSYPPDKIYMVGDMDINTFLNIYEKYNCDFYICKLYNRYKVIRTIKNGEHIK